MKVNKLIEHLMSLPNQERELNIDIENITERPCQYCDTGKYKDQLGVIPKFKYCPMCGRKLMD